MTANPALYFAVRNVTFTPTVTGYIVTCYTNNPVHLYLRWTSTTPQKHVNRRIVRGAPIGTYIDQCFVVYTDLEQNEAGDTWTHTFTVDNWTYCITRWFYFWGKVGGVLSPSASCIFEYHSDIYPYLDFYPAQDSGGDSVDGQSWRSRPSVPYPNIHDGPGTGHTDTNSDTAIYIRAYSPDYTYGILHRTLLTFPTDTIPPTYSIKAAELRLYCWGTDLEAGYSPTVNVFSFNPTSFNQLYNQDYQRCGSTPLSTPVDINTFTVNNYMTFTLNPLGLSYITPGQKCAFSIREASYDAPNIDPAFLAYQEFGAFFYTADKLTPSQIPRLRVFYLPA